MRLYSSTDSYTLYHGNMLDMDEVIAPNSIDSIVTDPPYELNFMNKGWDNSGIAFQKETWSKCYNALKPGGHLLAFGGSRTFHRIACAIEDAGFEIRDTIMWLYGSGFPKSMNIGLSVDKENGTESKVVGSRKDHDIRNNNYANNDVSTKTFVREIKEAQNEWKGWGTALKPSYEPIIVARKPVENSVTKNVLKWGVGGINIDECRVGNETISIHNAPKGTFAGGEYGRGSDTESYRESTGRFPANTILTYDETDFEEVCGGFPNTKDYGGSTKTTANNNIQFQSSRETYITRYKESGSASRYFYCAKASKKDRDEGLEEFAEKNGVDITGRKENTNGLTWDGGKYAYGNAFAGAGSPKKNTHPTVKPTELMQYLVRLVSPNGATILDCFNGSGSTGKAVMYENREHHKNYKYIGIELTEEYLPISKARIEYVINLPEERDNQMTIFDFIGEENE